MNAAIRDAVYANYTRYLQDELRKLDLRLRRALWSLRQQEQSRTETLAQPEQFISYLEVEWLLESGGLAAADSAYDNQIDDLQVEIDSHLAAAEAQGIALPLAQISRLFNLSAFETEALLICLAPELLRKYDRIYAYLQNDITRQRPSVDLILNVLCRSDSERWQARSMFTDQAPLLRHHLLKRVDDPQSPSGSSGLAQFLAVDDRIRNYIFGANVPDGQFNSCMRITMPVNRGHDAPLSSQIVQLAAEQTRLRPLYVHLQGRAGIGKRTTAQAAAYQMKMSLLEIDAGLLFAHVDQDDGLLRHALREALLLQAIVYLHNLESLEPGEGVSPDCLKRLTPIIEEYAWLIILGTRRHFLSPPTLGDAHFHAFTLSIPDAPAQQEIWDHALDERELGVAREWSRVLTERFRLTPGQIQSAADQLKDTLTLNRRNKLDETDVFSAARNQSAQILNNLAAKVQPRYGWDDIVLPEKPMSLLHELCAQVRNQQTVFQDWGFADKVSYGRGISALFFGTPGTGKTLAAQVIAGTLRLDLYKIDLSAIVSKYIGETEKNLQNIFQEAEDSNAILFFDEADALFGKRTDIKDAHDRYANVETSYLLQKMEDYTGIVILATNLRENMDDAFVRRIRFIVEFPFPDVRQRLLIWQAHIPDQVPLSADVDFAMLAERFAITGGSIKNIVLNAAFRAADDGQSLGIHHLLHSTRREYEKMGKTWESGAFENRRTNHA